MDYVAAKGVVDQHETHNCAEQIAGCAGHSTTRRQMVPCEAAQQAAAQGVSERTKSTAVLLSCCCLMLLVAAMSKQMQCTC